MIGGDARVLFTTRHGGVSEGPYASLNLGERTGDDPGAVATNLARLRGRIGRAHRRVAPRSTGASRAPDRPARRRPARRPTASPRTSAASPRSSSPPTACPSRSARPGASRWSTPAGAASPPACSRRASRRCATSVRRDRSAPRSGPAPAGCCYEVGDEVRDGVRRRPRGRAAAATSTSRRSRAPSSCAAGVAEVHDSRLCTICDERFFSHRRDRGTTGRQGGVAWLT